MGVWFGREKELIRRLSYFILQPRKLHGQNFPIQYEMREKIRVESWVSDMSCTNGTVEKPGAGFRIFPSCLDFWCIVCELSESR